MKESNETIADDIIKKSVSRINKDLEIFRKQHAEVIGQLISEQRFDDLIKVMYKQGFLTGMKFTSDWKKELTLKQQ